MRSFLLFLFLAASAFSQPVVSNVRVGDQTHSTIQLVWDSNVTPDLQRALIGPANAIIAVAGGTATATFPVAHRIPSGTATVYVFNSATVALNTGNAGATATYSSPTVLTWTTAAGNGTYTDANVYSWVENGIDGPGAYAFAFNQNIALSGFNPGVTWDICVQSHNGSGWSSCTTGVNLRTAFQAAPSVDPAPPIPPTPFSYDYPNMAGATSTTMAPDCSDWDEKWATAYANRASGNTFLYVPQGAVCTGAYLIPREPTAGQLDVSLTNFETNALSTRSPTVHGLSVNDGVRFGADTGNGYVLPIVLKPGVTYYVKTIPSASTFTLSETPGGPTMNLLPYVFTADPSTDYVRIDGSVGSPSYFMQAWFMQNWALRIASTGTLPGGLSAGTTYYGVNCDSTSITGRCKLSLSPGGPAIDITGAGTGTHSIGLIGLNFPYFLKWPPAQNWIVFRTDASDAQLPPDHIQMNGPSYSALLPKFIAQNSSSNSVRPLTFGGLNHHIYLEGLEFTQSATAAGDPNLVDPASPPGFFMMNSSADHITWSRNYIHGLGCPDRIWNIQYIEGTHVAFDSNDVRNIDACRPAYTGLALTFTSTTVPIASGTVGTPNNPLIAFAGTTFTITNGANSGANGYVSMSNEGALRFTVRTGVIGSCAPVSCTVTNSASPAFPTAAGRITEVPIGTFTMSAGTVTGALNVSDGTPQSWMANTFEGPTALATALGPGPIAITNNYTRNLVGISYHIDDGGYGWLTPSDIDVSRNQWIIDPDRVYGQTGSNGRLYAHRNQGEVKTGQRIRFRGNLYDGNFQHVTGSGSALQIPSTNASFTLPPAQNIVSDILVEYNTIRNTESAIFGTGGQGGGRQPKVARRIEYSNNLVYNLQGWTRSTTKSVKWPHPQGYAFTWGIGGEDVVLKHNTFYDSRGSMAAWGLMQYRKVHGFAAMDNIFFFGSDTTVSSPSYGVLNAGLANDQPQCGQLTGEAMMKCMFTPGFTFSGNVLVAGYADTKNQTTPVSAGTIAAQYPSTPLALIPQAATVADRVASLKFQRAPIPPNGFHATAASHNLRLRVDSAYASGAVPRLSTTGLGAGANIDEAEDAQGIVKNVRTLNISSSGATIAFHAPDAGAACYVGYGSGLIGTWTPSAFDPITWLASPADTSPGKERSVELSGLLDGATYFYQVWCEGAAPTSTQSLRTL